ncbi:MAG: hypothetical protein JSW33_11070 [bacterium]|nr:MAG: hypothetical protein JSW33_11070 [bacterium]
MRKTKIYNGKMIIFTMIYLGILYQCDSLPDKPSYLYYDPNNPDYQKPRVTILTPSNDAVIASDEVTFAWESNTPGQSYIYRLDNNPYSPLTMEKSVSFQNLVNGMHYFSVYGRYPTGYTSTSAYCRFLIWNYGGPGLTIYPAEISQYVSWVFYVQLIVIDTSPINSVYCKILYNSAVVEATTIDFYGNDQAFLLQNGGNLVNNADIDSLHGQIVINSQVMNGTPPDVDGSGRIAELGFRFFEVGTTRVEISTDSYFMNSSGTQIPLTLFQESTLIATDKQVKP